MLWNLFQADSRMKALVPVTPNLKEKKGSFDKNKATLAYYKPKHLKKIFRENNTNRTTTDYYEELLGNVPQYLHQLTLIQEKNHRPLT